MDLEIVILAAGFGTRMKSKKAKVLHTISNKPMIYYVIKESLKLTHNVSVVLYHQKQSIEKEIKKYFNNIQIYTQDIKNYPGTGGAIKNIQFRSKKVLILNGDMPLIQAKELKQFYSTSTITMGVIHLDNAYGYGRVVIKNDKVVKIIEQKDCTQDELNIKFANSGVYLFDSDFLQENISKLNNNNAQKEYYLTDLIEIAIKNNYEVKPIFVKEENFKGVNSKYDLANAEIIHQKRLKKYWMEKGIIFRLPDTVFIDESVEFDGECGIESGVVIKGNSVIKNSQILSNSIIENAIIQNSQIGPMARIRPNSNIINSKIGNFVETKNANLDEVKAGHLSYLGDCEIGNNTNIGAGTITCNYDGKNKYKTIIGKNCFIGSDTKFIAPIKMENNSMTASGSVISNNINEGELAIERTKQKNIKGFFYRFFKKVENA